MIKKIKQFTIEKVMQDDQNGVWVKAAHLGRTCWISLSLFGESDEYGYSKLRSLGVNILSLAAKTDAKNRLQEVVPNGTILVAQRPGYLFADKDVTKRPICYAYGSGDLIFPQKTKRPEIIVGFKPQKSFESRGDFPTFQKEMSILINGQPIPVLVLTMSLVPILQPFAPPEMYIENIILELCGRSSSGKSAVAVGLGGAVWGGNPRSKTGFFKTWNSTVNATEESLPRYQNALIGLDEATVASGNAKKRGEDISNFTHRLSLGELKQRMGHAEEPPVSLVAISTSNQSLSSICEESPEVMEALETRLMTVKIPNSRTNIFNHLPHGFKDFESARNQFYVIGKAHYGHTARNMIAKTLEKYDEDSAKLTSSIRKLMLAFMEAAGYDQLDTFAKRTFPPFALAYAAGILAKRWGVLDQKLFGNFMKPLLHAWQLSSGEIKVDVRERYLAYLREHVKRIAVVKSKKRLELTDDQFNNTKAFIIKSRDGKYFAAFPPHFMTSRFQGFESDFQKMRDADLIVADKSGLQTKHRIRMKDGEVQHDRVYMIRLNQWPLD